MRKFVTVRYRIPGFHQWPNAPKGQEYLRSLHRHEFHFTIFLEVFHEDREVEFIQLKEELADYTQRTMAEFDNSYSCEMLGDAIVRYLTRVYEGRSAAAWVEEDGENGALVTTEHIPT